MGDGWLVNYNGDTTCIWFIFLYMGKKSMDSELPLSETSAYNPFPFVLYQFVFIKDLIFIDKILNLSVHVLYKWNQGHIKVQSSLFSN